MLGRKIPGSLRLLGFASALLLMAGMPVHAAQTCKNSNGSLCLQSLSSIQSSTAYLGQSFQAFTPEPICRESNCIPAGTIFTGTVIRVKHAHRFHRPGVLGLQIQSVQPPSHAPIMLNASVSKSNSTTLRDYNATTWRYTFVKSVPGILAGVMFPAYLARCTTLNPRHVFVIGTAVGLGADIGQEVVWPTEKDASIPKRVVYGLLESFYIPDIIDLFHKQPQASITMGQPVQLKLPASTMEMVYAQASVAKTLMVSQPEPVDIVDTVPNKAMETTAEAEATAATPAAVSPDSLTAAYEPLDDVLQDFLLPAH